MINVRSVKQLYDSLSDGTKAPEKLDDLDTQQCDQMKTVYQQYARVNAGRPHDFFEFLQYLYPNLTATDLYRIREGMKPSLLK